MHNPTIHITKQNTSNTTDDDFSMIGSMQQQARPRIMSFANDSLDESECEWDVYYLPESVNMVSTELGDAMIIEQSQKYTFLQGTDWRKIILKKNLEGYKTVDIHISLLTSKLDFIERRRLWCFFCQIDQTRSNIDKEKPYKKLKQKPNPKYAKQIDNDCQRCNFDSLFHKKENQQSLREILNAYSNYDNELGYTQGMSYIVAQLMICYDMSHNDQSLDDYEVVDNRDEIVYSIFQHIMIKNGWRTLFLDGLPGLIQMIKKLKEKIQQKLPEIYQHFQNLKLPDCIELFNQFYLSIMMYKVPSKFSRTILDLFLFEGEEIIHLMILAMLKHFQDTILKMNDETLIVFIQQQMLAQFYEYINSQLHDCDELAKNLQRIGLIQCQEIDVGPQLDNHPNNFMRSLLQ